MNTSQFNANEWLRYTRHIQLPQIGVSGQDRLKRAKVLIIGAGGLGSPVALYLAAAGVGQITLMDGDKVDLSNLQRQVLFATEDINQPKAKCAQQRLLELNGEINVSAVTTDLREDNAAEYIGDADLVMDCTDNFASRYLINDTCVSLKKPWIFASIYQFSGQCALFTPNSACFRCLFPEAPEEVLDCNDAGVLGVLPGILGTHQANEAIKYLTGLPCPLENHLLLIEALNLDYKKIRLQKNQGCVCSGQKAPEKQSYQRLCSSDGRSEMEITAAGFNQERENDHVITLDVRSNEERQAFNIGGKHIPLDDLAGRYAELNPKEKVLCYCQTGKRSRKAVEILLEQGYQSLSLQGGLAKLIQQVDHL